ncbi:DUF3574 domain-containing protein [Streptomyces sp. SID13031]|uniref:DUF3574 domain-containing protein n=1 Tax=Streptomyces sp. SID13031 TaxID=2706046 RepID=UPI0013C69CB0|nr:DUF3574 domain-containing protein [Streptomyces sp. SID13031]NEA31367.1 DUF3574 domain-containing protein [Streptomyces sp. SID13031]
MPKFLPRLLAGGVLVAAVGLTTAPANSQLSPPTSAVSEVAALHRAPGTTFLRTELYFGSQKPRGQVSPAQFDRFVDQIVTPRFPDGLTQLTGKGQFLGSTGPIEERSFVLILLYPVIDQTANREIEEIRASYKKLFEQESVLRADSRDLVSF